MTVTVTAADGSDRELADDAVDGFRAQLRGPVVSRAKAAGLPERAPTWNALHEGRPGLTAHCSGIADVVNAVTFARDNGLLVAVRGGGHSVAGLSTIDGGMLIDLSGMRGVHIDADRRLAHVQGGATLSDLDREAQALGLATPLGRESRIGVAGLTLGGGYGHLSNRYGLSCDNLVEAQVVCADGQVRTASADSHPDLYWALRGGGGNFGVVTSFTFRLHPVGPIVAFASPVYAMEDAGAVLRNWRAYVEDAPDDVTSVVVTGTFPSSPGLPEAVADRPIAIVLGVYAGDAEEGMLALQPLRELGTPLADLSQPMPYTVVQSAFDFDAYFPRREVRAYWSSQYLDRLGDDAIDAFAAVAAKRPTPLTMVNLYHFGGAVRAVAPGDTAFAQRSASFMVAIEGHWADPDQDAECVGWIRSASETIAGYGTGATYLNFSGRLQNEPMGAGVNAALSPNLQRLREVKATYDPDNFFRYNDNVSPAVPANDGVERGDEPTSKTNGGPALRGQAAR